MFRHSALFRFRDAVPPERVTEFHLAVTEALDRIPHVTRWAAGPALGIQAGGYDYALHLDFCDPAEFGAYKRHPVHLALIEEQIALVVADTARIQIEL